ncbi:MAG: cupredoxin domain-containing protein [Nitrospirae bacterium]|nr:cupredoxin domain-containing protein [Nitrospirota bacterium]
MKKSAIIFVLTIPVLLLISAHGISASGDSSSAAMVAIEGSAFSPAMITVKAGQEVVWKNKDAAAHTVTANDGSFDSGTLNQGDEFKRTFTSPGTIKYSCDNHAWMSGTIEVR